MHRGINGLFALSSFHHSLLRSMTAVFIAAVTFASAGVAHAQTDSPPPASQPQSDQAWSDRSEQDRAVLLQLSRPTHIEFVGNELLNVVEYVRNVAGVNLFVNWGQLQSERIPETIPITLELGEVPIATALPRILEAAAGKSKAKLDWEVEDGIVVISTAADIRKRMSATRVYDIRDIISENMAREPNAKGGYDGLVSRTISLVTSAVSPDGQWGDDIGSITEIGGRLVIRTHPRAHTRINEKLTQIRQSSAVGSPSRNASSLQDTAGRSFPTDSIGSAVDFGPRKTDADQWVDLKLRNPLPTNFAGNKFSSVLDYIAASAAVTIEPDWKNLHTFGIDEDCPITLQLADVPAWKTLQLVLEIAAAGNTLDPITYTIHEGKIRIAREMDLKQSAVTSRIYDVRGILAAQKAASGLDDNAIADRMLELVRGVTLMEEWVDYGGSINTAQLKDAGLIVRTYPRAHHQINAVLAILRR